VAGPDWLTINSGLGVSGTINVGDPAMDLTIGFDATGKAVGTYVKNINVVTNELSGAKNSYIIPVTMHVGYQLTGNVYYGATDTKPMTTITMVTLTGTTPPVPAVTVSPTTGGAYSVRPVDNGVYALTGATTKAWSGMTTFDATLILRFAGGVPGYDMLTNLQKRAADVNMTNTAGGVTTFDATLILRRAGSVATPQWTAPDWVFDGPYPSVPAYIGLDVTVSGADVIQNLRTLCSGDVNGSYTPWTP
jgi:hypothetical protein